MYDRNFPPRVWSLLFPLAPACLCNPLEQDLFRPILATNTDPDLFFRVSLLERVRGLPGR